MAASARFLCSAALPVLSVRRNGVSKHSVSLLGSSLRLPRPPNSHSSGASPIPRNPSSLPAASILLSSLSSQHFPGAAAHPPPDLSAGEENGGPGFRAAEGESWTAVLLGWLGAEQKHLRKYAEMYESRGIRSVKFVVPVRDVLGLDLGRKVEERIGLLALEIADWCSATEKDGRFPRLIFHTFSNTGWLAYGAILEKLQSRSDVIEKINGCIFDSGGDPELNPQVWAAGFSTALLKKRSGDSTTEVLGPNKSNVSSPLSEGLLSAFFVKFFTIFLNLPDVNRRLTKIISTLMKRQPWCSQLYLYSSADRVIPVSSIESFILEQKASGRGVRAHNFLSSPHVDHFRSFPHVYASEVSKFLEACGSVELAVDRR